MKLPGSARGSIGFSTDSRKKLIFNVYSNASWGYHGYNNNIYAGMNISYKPTNYLSVTLSPGINKSYSELQYVSTVNYNEGDKYIFACIDQKVINTSFRVNFNLSPNLTFQYWGQPFVATGKYYDYKYITRPMADIYTDRFQTYSQSQISLNDNSYNIDENLDGKPDYSFDRIDFNVREFLSNFVIRWEYNPGSSLYLVWSQTRSSYNDSGTLNLFNDLGDLFNATDNKPHNVFLIKFSYRFGLK